MQEPAMVCKPKPLLTVAVQCRRARRPCSSCPMSPPTTATPSSSIAAPGAAAEAAGDFGFWHNFGDDKPVEIQRAIMRRAFDLEAELLDVLEREGVGCIAFTALAQSLVTERYLNGAPADSRAALNKSLDAASIKERLPGIRALNEIALDSGQILAQPALAWVLQNPGVTSTLIGASSVGQLGTTCCRPPARLHRRRADRHRPARRRLRRRPAGRRPTGDGLVGGSDGPLHRAGQPRRGQRGCPPTTANNGADRRSRSCL